VRRAFAAVAAVAALVTVAAATLALSVTPASAATPNGTRAAAAVQPMTNPADCSARNDFVVIQSGWGTFCYANAGWMVFSPGIDQVTSVCSGNNMINFWWQYNPGQTPNQTEYLDKGKCRDFVPTPGNTTVVQLHIW
jgi:hypothetical protein